jgi:hypothetical protein
MPFVDFYDKYLPSRHIYASPPARYYDYLDYRPARYYEYDCYRPASAYPVYYADHPRVRYVDAQPTRVMYVDSDIVRYEEPIHYRRYFDDHVRVYPARYDVELLPVHRRPYYEYKYEVVTPRRPLVRCESEPRGSRRNHELDDVYDDVKEGRINRTEFKKAIQRTPSTVAPDGSPAASGSDGRRDGSPANLAVRFDAAGSPQM